MGNLILLNSAGKRRQAAAVDVMTKSLESHLNGIAAHFADPRITLIVRTEKGGDLIMTNDTTLNAVAALVSNDPAAAPFIDEVVDLLDVAN